MRRRTGLLAALFGTALAASSWLVYRHEGAVERRGKRARRFAQAVDPVLRRAERDGEATEYEAGWGPRRVA
jgi:hypothetical protein